MTLPKHLQASACHICGGEKHAPTNSHEYWSNADAATYFHTAYVGQREDGYAEAKYMDEYIGR